MITFLAATVRSMIRIDAHRVCGARISYKTWLLANLPDARLRKWTISVASATR